jgi:hypothetical protein
MVELKQFHRLDDLYDRNDRVTVPTLDTGRRMGLAEVELGFTPEQARCEANRCLRCFANILLDVDKCVLCALCADVCPVERDLARARPRRSNPAAPAARHCMLDEEPASAAGCVSNVVPRRPVDGCVERSRSTGMTSSTATVPALGRRRRYQRAGVDRHRLGARRRPARRRFRQSPRDQIGKSIFRSPRRVTPRDRAAGHWSSFLLHIYPVKMRRKELEFRTRGTSA